VTSVYPERERTEWIIKQRPARAALDPFQPHGFFLEQELCPSGQIYTSAAILLTNKECPWRCLMCDLWKNTLPYTVPPGAIPAQLEYAFQQLGVRPSQIKLYNSGSFFDSAAIPVGDYALIAEKIAFAERVIVECHPRLIGERVTRFNNLLHQENHCTLEVAMGLETIHPQVFPRLNKRFDLADFASAVRFLREQNIDCRAFVLVKPPFLNESEAVDWAIRSAEYALDCGATTISLIPTRAGNGAMERLIESHEFSPPRLSTLERAFDTCLKFVSRPRMNSNQAAETRATTKGLAVLSQKASRPRTRVFADTWNLDQFSNCRQCFGERRARVAQMNLTQEVLPAIHCSACGSL
jgi:radical SAM enzyme (TIGR01210 family)